MTRGRGSGIGVELMHIMMHVIRMITEDQDPVRCYHEPVSSSQPGPCGGLSCGWPRAPVPLLSACGGLSVVADHGHVRSACSGLSRCGGHVNQSGHDQFGLDHVVAVCCGQPLRIYHVVLSDNMSQAAPAGVHASSQPT